MTFGFEEAGQRRQVSDWVRYRTFSKSGHRAPH